MPTFGTWAIRKKDVRKLAECFYLLKCFSGKVGVTVLQCNQIGKYYIRFKMLVAG
jgi:hypothetical protein